MDSYYNPYASGTVAEQAPDRRMEFIRKTYWHLAGAIAVFALLETLLVQAGLGEAALNLMQGGKYSWLIVLGAFMGVSMMADRWARSSTSKATQYLGLGVYVVAEAIIFLPIITMAPLVSGDPAVIGKAGVVTGAIVLGLTAIAMTTRKDFTFLGGFLKIAGLIAIALIVASVFLPITLGFWFAAAMALFACGSILYNTSAIQYHYLPEQYVAASLSLFASVALLFWYVLRLFMNRN